jgi:hypothetical protein
MKNGTPWGFPQQIKPLGTSGLFAVSCANHGGIFVPDAKLAEMPAALRSNVYGGGNWFEEDCEWALACLAFPEAFPAESLPHAVRTVEAYLGRDPYAAAAAWLASPAGDSIRARLPVEV